MDNMLTNKLHSKKIILALIIVFVIGVSGAIATVIINADILLQLAVTVIGSFSLLLCGIVLLFRIMYYWFAPVENRKWPTQTILTTAFCITAIGAIVVGLWVGNNLRIKYNEKQVVIIVEALEDYYSKNKMYPQDLNGLGINIPKKFGGGEFNYYSRNYDGKWFFAIGFWAEMGDYYWNKKTKQFEFSMRD